MVLYRNEGNTSTLFQFTGKTKVLARGSLSPDFEIRVERNKRIGAKDILHKKGIRNRILNQTVYLSGANRFTDLATLVGLAEAETTIYLDTEEINDAYNGTYLFIGKVKTDINEKTGLITIKYQIIEEVN